MNGTLAARLFVEGTIKERGAKMPGALMASFSKDGLKSVAPKQCPAER